MNLSMMSYTWNMDMMIKKSRRQIRHWGLSGDAKVTILELTTNTNAVEQTYGWKKNSSTEVSLRSVPNTIEVTRIPHKGCPTFIKS